MKIYVGLRRPLCVCNANQQPSLRRLRQAGWGEGGGDAEARGEKELRKREEGQTQQK